LKAALAAKNLDYPFTHELHELMELAVPHSPELGAFAANVAEYTEFAVRLRYDDLPWVTKEEAERALREVENMRDALLPRLI
jgi:HEPN domain-containing protein